AGTEWLQPVAEILLLRGLLRLARSMHLACGSTECPTFLPILLQGLLQELACLWVSWPRVKDTFGGSNRLPVGACFQLHRSHELKVLRIGGRVLFPLIEHPPGKLQVVRVQSHLAKRHEVIGANRPDPDSF